jgi:serine/threonine protein phosphatase PrpC
MEEERQSQPTARQSARWSRFAARAAASGVTDAGGAESVNQDAFFVLPVDADAGHRALVVGVFDGHGKESGRHVARTACAFFEREFRGFAREDLERLERDPRGAFRRLYATCHEHIKETLRDFYESSGFVVYEQPEGFLIKQDPISYLFANVRGGTTATIAVVLDGGRKVLVSNVGDSAALLTGDGVSQRDVKIYNSSSSKASGEQSKALSSSLEDTEDEDELDTLEIRESCTSVASTAASLDPGDNQTPLALADTDMVALTGDHGADSACEFLRVRHARCCESDPSMPELRFLYDSASASSKRLPVFSWRDGGELRRNLPGDYYKNVRDEWATVVATPLSSLFPDALAFTRSLGDFHMHAYGVSCEPTVVELSLERVAARSLGLDEQDNQDESLIAEPGNEDNQERPRTARFTLVVASDGVWDNWKYEELLQSLAKSRAKASAKAREQDEEQPVEAMAAELMAANLRRAAETFGDQADNMTAVVCELELTCLE